MRKNYKMSRPLPIPLSKKVFRNKGYVRSVPYPPVETPLEREFRTGEPRSDRPSYEEHITAHKKRKADDGEMLEMLTDMATPVKKEPTWVDKRLEWAKESKLPILIDYQQNRKKRISDFTQNPRDYWGEFRRSAAGDRWVMEKAKRAAYLERPKYAPEMPQVKLDRYLNTFRGKLDAKKARKENWAILKKKLNAYSIKPEWKNGNPGFGLWNNGVFQFLPGGYDVGEQLLSRCELETLAMESGGFLDDQGYANF